MNTKFNKINQFPKIRTLQFLIISLLFLNFLACKTRDQSTNSVKNAFLMFEAGQFQELNLWADSIYKTGVLLTLDSIKIDSLCEITSRIKRDFRLTETDVRNKLKIWFPGADSMSLDKWENNLKLEMRIINGEKRYFSNAVSNLFRLDDEAKKVKTAKDGISVDSLDLFCLKHTEEIIDNTISQGALTNPVSMILNYTITVEPNVVPDGKIIRCWMPFARVTNQRQTYAEIIDSEPAIQSISPETDLQRTVYLEKKALKDEPAIFNLKYKIKHSAQYFDLDASKIQPYDTTGLIFKEFTKERYPQIVFSEQMKKLSDEIVTGEKNPLLKFKKIYKWINENIRWASALEYSIIPNIPEYVVRTGHGDCGMQTLLLMTLARLQGIPVKWQSGWMLHPGEVNLHDWAEVHFEGIGWVPVDQSFGLQKSENEKVRDFYNTGIDSYRLIVNDDFGRELTPMKKFLRSEPYDFQRGELEWEGGNLYFDKWDWHMDVEYQYTKNENK